MKVLVYTVYDVATETFMTPIFAKTQAEAMRSFSDASNDKSTPMGKHPADYSLFKIGEYTDHNADLRSCPPECIISALECTQNSKE